MSKIHLDDMSRAFSPLFWTFCGLYSSSRKLPYEMTDKVSDVTCKNCLRGLRPEKYRASLRERI